MKTIIAGSRSIVHPSFIERAVEHSHFQITEVVTGMARGPDKNAKDWGIAHGIPVKEFRAVWWRYKQGAGTMRNTEMAEYSDALIAIWDGVSKGTDHMIKCATKKGLYIYIHRVTQEEIIATTPPPFISLGS